MLASHVLGRNFNEDVESFYERKPDLKEFREWTKGIVVDKNFNIIEKK